VSRIVTVGDLSSQYTLNSGTARRLRFSTKSSTTFDAGTAPA
jgi:hypothetical protein